MAHERRGPREAVVEERVVAVVVVQLTRDDIRRLAEKESVAPVVAQSSVAKASL
jgi:hypothetical protein